MGGVRRSFVFALVALVALVLVLLARLPPPPPPPPPAALRAPSPPHNTTRTDYTSPPSVSTDSSDVRTSLSQVKSQLTEQKLLISELKSPVSESKSSVSENRSAVESVTSLRVPGVLYTGDVYVSGHARAHAELCPSLGARVRVLVLVTSAPSHAAARAALRLTWGHYAARVDVTIAFVLGTPPPALQPAIDAEDQIYGDIIIGRFVDSYSNLTLKTLSMLEWADTYCPRAPRLLKTDDDMFINIPRLLEFISAPSRANATLTVWGKVVHKSLPKRTTKSKYYVSPLQFAGKVFPDFATGPAYLMTSDCIRPLLRAASDEPYVRLEDVFVTGVLASRLNIKRVHTPQFYNKKVAAHPCAVQRGLAIHMVRYHEQFDLWRKLLDGTTKCAT